MHGILSYKTWLIEPMFANRMAPLILRSIEQGTTEKFFQQNRESNDKKVSRLYGGIDAEREWPDDGPSYYVAVSKSKKNVAIVSMIGSITKNGESCSYGMRDYENTLAHIAKDERVSGVVIHFNNAPGGSHDGTPEISEIIANYPKSIIAFVDGYAASAHYYMASQSDHIMMNSKTDSEVGSIGSLIVMENIQNMVDAGNFPKIEIIRAPQSVNKALVNAIEELPKGARAELNADLKKTVDGFIAAVKSGRGSVLKDDGLMFTGQMYATDDAIGNGLADSKGTLQDAINLAADMKAAIPAQSKSSSTNKTNMSLKSKVSSFFGKTQKKSAEAAAAEPAEDTTPMWTDTMVFNTDGSGDGAFCLHPDSDGNDRKFETKTDGNTGHEPPTDPATTEDENWSVVSEPAAEAKAEEKVEETSSCFISS
jgi:protease IV